jgi:hypothetical protein
VNDADLMASLTDEVRALIQQPEVLKAEQLDGLSRTIAELRDEAVKARRESGIEATWLKCEEAYLGIDDLNRSEFAGAKWAKATTINGPLVAVTKETDDTKATAFVRLTARYVNAGHAKVCEIALPADGKAFTLKATPVPEMSDAVGDETPAEQITGQPMPGPDGNPVTVDQLAKHAIDVAEKAAEKAATRIHDWMVEYKHPAEIRKVVFDGARIGVGVLCGPIPESKRVVVVRKAKPAGAAPGLPNNLEAKPIAKAAAVTVEVVEQVKPVARWLDPWCFYPAPGCGEDIHKGDHAFELDQMLETELSRLAKQTKLHFLPKQIAKVIEEGPGKSNVDNGDPNRKPNKKAFDVWHFRGNISRAEFLAANEEQASKLDKAMDRVDVVVTLVNDTVIRAIRSPMDSGRLPYHVFCWSRRAGHWAGVGVAEQADAPQRIVNGGTRAMLNNGGMSAGAQVVMDPNAVEPANKSLKITPDKLWFIKNGTGVEDVRKVFAAFEWPNMTDQLMKIVEYGFKLAEEHTSIPLISQGQSGKTTPDTFGGQQLQDNNANQLLRDVGFGLNDTVTTPLVDQFYEWLLLDPDVPDAEKGDYNVDTSGALALIEKALQDMTILAVGQLLQNKAFKIDPAKWFASYMRSKRLSPAEFQYTDAEWEKVSQEPPPEAPVITAAKIRAESAEKVAQSRDGLAAEKIRVDTDRDTAFIDSQARRDQAVADSRMAELRLKERIAELEYQTRIAEFALQRDLSLDDAKTTLAKTTMELRTQVALATGKDGAEGGAPQVADTAMEPVGQAPDGQAFQR